MTDVSITIDKYQLQKILDTLKDFNKDVQNPNNGLDFTLPNVRSVKASGVIPIIIKNLTPVLDCADIIDTMTFRTNKVSNFTISGTTCTYLIGVLVGMDKHGMIKTGIF